MAMTEADKIQKYGPIVAKVNSNSDPDKIWDVRMRGGVYNCGCKGWIFSKESPRSCRHTRAAQGKGPISKTSSTKKTATTRPAAPTKSRWVQVIEQLFRDVPVIGRLVQRYLSQQEQVLAIQAMANSLEVQLGALKAAQFQAEVAIAAAEVEEEEGIRLITLAE